MTTIHGPEHLVDMAILKLRAGLPARIATINAELTDITVDTTADDNYHTALIDVLPSTPSIIVYAGPAQYGGEGTHSFIAEYDLCVYILEEDLDREILGRRLQRQARGIIECLWDDDPKESLTSDAGAQIWRIRPRTTTPSPLFGGDQADSWRGYYLVIFQASMFEGD